MVCRSAPQDEMRCGAAGVLLKQGIHVTCMRRECIKEAIVMHAKMSYLKNKGLLLRWHVCIDAGLPANGFASWALVCSQGAVSIELNTALMPLHNSTCLIAWVREGWVVCLRQRNKGILDNFLMILIYLKIPQLLNIEINRCDRSLAMIGRDNIYIQITSHLTS